MVHYFVAVVVPTVSVDKLDDTVYKALAPFRYGDLDEWPNPVAHFDYGGPGGRYEGRINGQTRMDLAEAFRTERPSMVDVRPCRFLMPDGRWLTADEAERPLRKMASGPRRYTVVACDLHDLFIGTDPPKWDGSSPEQEGDRQEGSQ